MGCDRFIILASLEDRWQEEHRELTASALDQAIERLLQEPSEFSLDGVTLVVSSMNAIAAAEAIAQRKSKQQVTLASLPAHWMIRSHAWAIFGKRSAVVSGL